MAETNSSADKSSGSPIHTILARQLRALGVDPESLPDDPPWLVDLADDVSGYYEYLEKIRYRLERSIHEAFQKMQTLERSLLEYREEHAAPGEHYLDIFENSPVATWEEDLGAVVDWLRELEGSGVTDLRAYLDANPEEVDKGVALIEVTNANEAAARLVGAPDEAALLGPLRPERIGHQSVPSFLAQFQAIWDEQDSVRTQMVGSRFDGETFDAILEWRVLKVGSAFDYSRVLVTMVDISDQKAAEREAVETLKSRDEMLASVTHELRTPLAAVMGFAEVLRAMDEGDYEEERDGLLSIIAGQASDLSDMVEDLLASARSELGQLELARVPVNIHAQIAQVQEARPETDAPIAVPDRPDEPLLALGDPQRVRQILRNLITNANRYGGPRIEVTAEAVGDCAVVSVRDDGPGLEPGAEEHVFDRYYRAGTLHPGSVGLGLTIARDLARRMGGDLTYQHSDGWTSFVLELPVSN